jgi:hypothetical protein
MSNRNRLPAAVAARAECDLVRRLAFSAAVQWNTSNSTEEMIEGLSPSSRDDALGNVIRPAITADRQ